MPTQKREVPKADGKKLFTKAQLAKVVNVVALTECVRAQVDADAKWVHYAETQFSAGLRLEHLPPGFASHQVKTEVEKTICKAIPSVTDADYDLFVMSRAEMGKLTEGKKARRKEVQRLVSNKLGYIRRYLDPLENPAKFDAKSGGRESGKGAGQKTTRSERIVRECTKFASQIQADKEPTQHDLQGLKLLQAVVAHFKKSVVSIADK